MRSFEGMPQDPGEWEHVHRIIMSALTFLPPPQRRGMLQECLKTDSVLNAHPGGTGPPLASTATIDTSGSESEEDEDPHCWKQLFDDRCDGLVAQMLGRGIEHELPELV